MADGSIKRAVSGQVLTEIQNWVRESSARAEKGFKSAPRSEDVLTGAWASKLETDWSERRLSVGSEWRWKIEYRAFGSGNQYSSEENTIGADGIFQVEVDKYKIELAQASGKTYSLENVQLDSSFKKGILFQSKRHDSKEGPKKLVEQLKKMENAAPGGGAFFEFGPKGYKAASATDVIEAEGLVKNVDAKQIPSLGEFLASEFLACKVGLEGMYIDFDDNTLSFPEENNQVVKVRDEIGSGLRVEVRAFTAVDIS